VRVRACNGCCGRRDPVARRLLIWLSALTARLQHAPQPQSIYVEISPA
jgi:hypothetical protein